MKKIFIVLILIMSVILTGCTDNSATERFGSKDIKEIVYDYSVEETTDQLVYITPSQLVIKDIDDKEISYDVPKGEFLVSIAPFINQTHPCATHYIVGCQGELDNQDFDFYIEDIDGNVVYDETRNSGANGFIDIWLPSDQEYNVLISYEDKKVGSRISTFKDDDTCITTMQLT